MDFLGKLFVTTLMVAATASAAELEVPEQCRQILQVTTKSWDAPVGVMTRWEKKLGKWKPVGETIPVTVGRAGLGWGRGIHRSNDSGPVKKEGDGKAPAGVFALGTAYGYDKKAPKNCRLPWRQATPNDFFVDDVGSPDYNRWVHLAKGVAEADNRWKSYEKMRRPDDLYELGIVVNHNMNPTLAGAGSAIFIHLWRGPGKPTAGCTAMSQKNLLIILAWLKPGLNPVLIQAPEGVYDLS